MAERDLVEWGRRHHGVITRDDARRHGLTDRQIRRRATSGRWQELRPGVFLLEGVEAGSIQRLLGAVRATDGVASHRSAAWLLGLADRAPTVPEVSSAARSGHHRVGVVHHRVRDLVGRDITMVRGIRTTTATRTCLDLGSVLGVAELERVVNAALHRRLTHLDPLVARFLQLAGSGRAGTTTVRAVLTRLDPSVPAESDLETVLVQALRRAGLPAPARQFEVVVGGRRRRIDLAYPELMIAIESDGFAHHGHRLAFEEDRVRQNELVLAGWTVLRFTWRQIHTDAAGVAAQVVAARRVAALRGRHMT